MAICLIWMGGGVVAAPALIYSTLYTREVSVEKLELKIAAFENSAWDTAERSTHMTGLFISDTE